MPYSIPFLLISSPYTSETSHFILSVFNHFFSYKNPILKHCFSKDFILLKTATLKK